MHQFKMMDESITLRKQDWCRL